jgi:uncharacterized membrane protein YkoI
MSRNAKLLAAAGSAVVLAAGGVEIAQAVNGGDSEKQATGAEAERAKRAAVKTVGGGRVVGVEREDDGRAGWEVEVLRSGGQQLEVHLSPDLERVGLEADDDGSSDGDEGDDD